MDTLGGVFTPLVNKGTPTPCEKVFTFSTAADNQDQIQIFLYRGTQKVSSKNHFLGQYQIVGIAPAPRGVPKIEVFFGVNDRKIWITATDFDSKKQPSIIKKK